MVGWKFTVFLLCFTLYLRAIFKYNPLGSLYLEGRFNGWFFAFTSLGGLQMEGLIFGILRYLAQILGQYFTGPGFCRPFFVRWTGVDFGNWDVTWDLGRTPRQNVYACARLSMSLFQSHFPVKVSRALHSVCSL